MRILIFLNLFFWAFLSGTELNEKKEALNYSICRNDYTFSTVFDMSHHDYPLGSVVKGMFHATTQYDVYDRFGLYEGQGVSRTLSLGFFYPWAAQLDIYDVQGNKIGCIDGQEEILASDPAKFNFYNEENQIVATARLNKKRTCFTLSAPKDASLVLANLTKIISDENQDFWEVEIYFPDRISPTFIKIFAAYICDCQGFNSN